MRRHFRSMRYQFKGDFNGFLWYAVENSGYDMKAKEHFRHAARGYKFQGDFEAFQRELEEWASRREEEQEQ